MDGVIEAERITSLVTLRLHSYHWSKPTDGHFVSADAELLDFALDPRPVSGRGKYAIEPGPQRRLGEVYYVPRGVRLDAHVEPCRARSLRCLLQTSRVEHLAELDARLPSGGNGLSISSVDVRGGLSRLLLEMASPGFASDLLIDAWTLATFVEVQRHLRGAALSAPGGGLAGWQLRAIDDRLQEDRPPPGLVELAAICRVSPRHLTRMFRNATGETAASYVARAQLRRAREMLSRSDRPIKQISFDLGFAGAASFSRSFRAGTGKSPNQFRREYRTIAPAHR